MTVTAFTTSDNVAAEAARRGWNQRRIAKALGFVSQSSVSNRMAGHRPWKPSEIEQLAQAWGIAPGELHGATS